MKEGREYGSNLTTLPAVIIIFVFFLTAAGFGQSGLAVFLFIVWLFALAAWAWGSRSLARLRLHVEGENCRAFPGGEINFSVSVTNDKALPLFWLTLEYGEPERGFLALEDRRFGFVGPGRGVTVRESLKAEARGVYHLEELVLCSGDGLGLAVKRGSFVPDNRLLLVVYPRIVKVDTSLLRRQSTEMDTGSRGYTEDVTLLRTSRDYSASDPARRINWRMLAGGGEMQVNVYEDILPRQLSIIIDTESFGLFEQKEENGQPVMKAAGVRRGELEEALSLAASVASALVQRREHVTLLVPAGPRDKGCMISGHDPDEVMPEMLTALAGINYDGGRTVFGRDAISSSALGDVFAFVCDAPSPACLELLSAVPEHRANLIVCGSGDAPEKTLLHRIEGRELRA